MAVGIGAGEKARRQGTPELPVSDLREVADERFEDVSAVRDPCRDEGVDEPEGQDRNEHRFERGPGPRQSKGDSLRPFHLRLTLVAGGYRRHPAPPLVTVGAAVGCDGYDGLDRFERLADGDDRYAGLLRRVARGY